MQEKVKVYASWVIVGFGVAAVLYVFSRYLLGVLLPFFAGWLAALFVKRPAHFLSRKTRVHEGALRLVLAALSVGTVGTLLVLGIKRLLKELSGLVGEEGIRPLDELAHRLSYAKQMLPSSLREGGEKVLSRFEDTLAEGIPKIISRLATALPPLLLGIGVGVIAAVYFCLDLERVHTALLRLLPRRWHLYVAYAKKSALRAALTVLRANFVLMLIAFAIMLFGFLVLGLPYPLLLSSLFALFDFLPVIGVGTFLLPWGVWLLLSGKAALGAGVLVIFAVTVAVRQFVEPHLLGAGYGMHPLLTLLSMYAGARLFGASGIVLAPMAAILVYGILFPPTLKQKEPRRTLTGKCE